MTALLRIVTYFRDSGSGGSSRAIFGIMGSLLVYIIRNRDVPLHTLQSEIPKRPNSLGPGQFFFLWSELLAAKW
jgi:hypothetical protein